jgi:hypothetical protein
LQTPPPPPEPRTPAHNGGAAETMDEAGSSSSSSSLEAVLAFVAHVQAGDVDAPPPAADGWCLRPEVHPPPRVPAPLKPPLKFK